MANDTSPQGIYPLQDVVASLQREIEQKNKRLADLHDHIEALASALETEGSSADALAEERLIALNRAESRFSLLVQAAKEYMKHSVCTVGADEKSRQALMDAMEGK